jgi:hypothetical protein
MSAVLPATRNGLLKQSRWLVAASAAACLALACGDVEAARMWMPKAENPYCDVPTYMLRDLPEQALSIRDSSGKPAIVVSQYTLADHPAYSRFLLAHECCHHSLGHMERFGAGLGQVGPQRFFYVAPALKQMELDADCCAVKLLKAKNETDGIVSAGETMMSFGSAETGAYYPTGIERAENIAKCAAQE